MAARKTPYLNQGWRDRIQTSMLINRLQDHVNGKVELTATQVNSAKILLGKTAPDLQSVTLSGDEKNPIRITSATDEAIIQRYLAQAKDKK